MAKYIKLTFSYFCNKDEIVSATCNDEKVSILFKNGAVGSWYEENENKAKEVFNEIYKKLTGEDSEC